MLHPGLAKKVTIYLNEDTAASSDFLYNEIFSFLLGRGVSGANLLRPDASFGSHHRVHEAGSGPGIAEHLPVRIEFVESVQKVEELMPDLCDLMSDGMIEAHDTYVYKAVARKGLSA